VRDLNDRTVPLHQQASQANIAYQHAYCALRDVDAKIKNLRDRVSSAERANEGLEMKLKEANNIKDNLEIKNVELECQLNDDFITLQVITKAHGEQAKVMEAMVRELAAENDRLWEATWALECELNTTRCEADANDIAFKCAKSESKEAKTKLRAMEARTIEVPSSECVVSPFDSPTTVPNVWSGILSFEPAFLASLFIVQPYAPETF
jgi:Rad3-related DNA helicase